MRIKESRKRRVGRGGETSESKKSSVDVPKSTDLVLEAPAVQAARSTLLDTEPGNRVESAKLTEFLRRSSIRHASGSRVGSSLAPEWGCKITNNKKMCCKIFVHWQGGGGSSIQIETIFQQVRLEFCFWLRDRQKVHRASFVGHNIILKIISIVLCD